jgi:hypothetical protein
MIPGLTPSADDGDVMQKRLQILSKSTCLESNHVGNDGDYTFTVICEY